MSALLKMGVLLSGLLALTVSTPAQAAVTSECQIQPTETKPNPLGMRSLFTLKSTSDGNVTATYSILPSPVSAQQPPVTIEQTRTLIFYNSTIPAVRDRMLKNSTLLKELTGFADAEGFKPINDLLVCKTVGAATPPKAMTIADLPDGDYRFWNGAPSMNVTDKQILAGALTFLFSKEGDRVGGYFARPSDLAMCVRGTIKGNVVSGTVNPPERFSNAQGLSMQNKPFDPAGALRLGKWSNAGNLGSFEPSTLDLSKFNRINLGPRRPSGCR